MRALLKPRLNFKNFGLCEANPTTFGESGNKVARPQTTSADALRYRALLPVNISVLRAGATDVNN